MNEAILKARDHRDVSKELDLGLSGTTFIDHLIGVVERAREDNPDDSVLNAGYEALKKEFPSYFSQEKRSSRPGHFRKRDVHKACYGF